MDQDHSERGLDYLALLAMDLLRNHCYEAVIEVCANLPASSDMRIPMALGMLSDRCKGRSNENDPAVVSGNFSRKWPDLTKPEPTELLTLILAAVMESPSTGETLTPKPTSPENPAVRTKFSHLPPPPSLQTPANHDGDVLDQEPPKFRGSASSSASSRSRRGLILASVVALITLSALGGLVAISAFSEESRSVTSQPAQSSVSTSPQATLGTQASTNVVASTTLARVPQTAPATTRATTPNPTTTVRPTSVVPVSTTTTTTTYTFLDQLWDDCYSGDFQACDDLYRATPVGSAYNEFADSCGNRNTPSGWCVDIYGPSTGGPGSDPYLNELWNACYLGDFQACDDLFFASPSGSAYQDFGDSCGNRNTPSGWCVDIYD